MTKDVRERSIDPASQDMLDLCQRAGLETAWDRLEKQQPQCGFGELGLCCRNCNMGPCRIDPFGDGPQRGICGADADVIVARNFGRMVAAGAASHSDHGRDLVETLLAIGEGTTTDYAIRDEAKLRRIAEEVGLDVAGKDTKAVALALAEQFYGDFGSRRDRSNSRRGRRRRW